MICLFTDTKRPFDDALRREVLFFYGAVEQFLILV